MAALKDPQNAQATDVILHNFSDCEMINVTEVMTAVMMRVIIIIPEHGKRGCIVIVILHHIMVGNSWPLRIST
jgi:hypothetical protein